MYNNTQDSNEQYNHSGPLFSQPFDPSTLNATSEFENMINSSMDSNYPWHFFTPQQQEEQQQQQQETPESILLSDPNFLRQHQLLQEQQKEMNTRLMHDDERHEQVSNLSAMFEPIVIKIEEQEAEEITDKKSKKSANRHHQVLMKNNSTMTDDDKVDHQRRFNELQARFRVNYARKQVNHVKSTHNKPVKPQPEPIIQSTPPIPIAVTTSMNTTTATTATATATTMATGGMDTPMKNKDENTTSELSSSFPSRTMPIQIQRVSRLNSNQPFDAESYQKQLDSQLDKVDFDDITVSELKEMLRQRGKPATGKKAVLLQRLLEEREISKGGRSFGSASGGGAGGSLGAGGGGRLVSNRHSQPVPFSRSVNMESPQRPRSFQSSSPVMIQTNASPGSPGASLHRSIANMHIGSPPNASRRYSPYSPRLSSSPKLVHHDYSSSVPLTHVELSTSPINTTNNIINNNNNNMMLSSSYSAKSCRYYNNPKTYKPFMSSALATPDREEDVNPFDSYYAQEDSTPIKEENYENTGNYFNDLGCGGGDNGGGGGGGGGGGDSSYIKQENDDFIDSNWMNTNAFDLLLQQQQQEQEQLLLQQASIMDNQQHFLSNEQILAMINTQQQQSSFDFKLDDSSFNQSSSYYHH